MSERGGRHNYNSPIWARMEAFAPGPTPERPAWRVYRATRHVNCRGCGRLFLEGFHLVGVRSAEPFLCHLCWVNGVSALRLAP